MPDCIWVWPAAMRSAANPARLSCGKNMVTENSAGNVYMNSVTTELDPGSPTKR